MFTTQALENKNAASKAILPFCVLVLYTAQHCVEYVMFFDKNRIDI